MLPRPASGIRPIATTARDAVADHREIADPGAKAIGVPRNRVTAIVHGDRAISADTALRLGRYLGMSAEFWLGLQTAYDLEIARQEVGKLEQIVPHAA